MWRADMVVPSLHCKKGRGKYGRGTKKVTRINKNIEWLLGRGGLNNLRLLWKRCSGEDFMDCNKIKSNGCKDKELGFFTRYMGYQVKVTGSRMKKSKYIVTWNVSHFCHRMPTVCV